MTGGRAGTDSGDHRGKKRTRAPQSSKFKNKNAPDEQKGARTSQAGVASNCRQKTAEWRCMSVQISSSHAAITVCQTLGIQAKANQLAGAADQPMP